MFQENLKTLRKKKGMTQEELAARLNVVRQTILAYCEAKRPGLRSKTAAFRF